MTGVIEFEHTGLVSKDLFCSLVRRCRT